MKLSRPNPFLSKVISSFVSQGWVIILFAFLIYSVDPVFAGKQSFPFLGEVTANKVNIRAGQSENFEKLCVLNKGDQVIVLEKSYSWYKIKIPGQAKSFVSDKYVKEIDPASGEITVDKVNVRSGANIDSSILGQLNAGARVTIVQKLKDWYQIRPTDNSYGWVLENLVTFKSRDIAAYAAPKVDLKTATPKQTPSDKMTLDGVIKDNKDFPSAATSFILVLKNASVYALKAPDMIVNDFRDRQVTMEGLLNKDVSASTIPIVNVSKIQLVF